MACRRDADRLPKAAPAHRDPPLDRHRRRLPACATGVPLACRGAGQRDLRLSSHHSGPSPSQTRTGVQKNSSPAVAMRATTRGINVTRAAKDAWQKMGANKVAGHLVGEDRTHAAADRQNRDHHRAAKVESRRPPSTRALGLRRTAPTRVPGPLLF
jgi:hypothetical protein